VSEKDKRRIVAARVVRDIRRRRAAARKERGRTMKSNEDFFEQIKVKMVMRIYHVSCERAKAIIVGRAAEKEAQDAKKTPRKRVRISRHVCDDDDEWLPVGKIVVGDEA